MKPVLSFCAALVGAGALAAMPLAAAARDFSGSWHLSGTIQDNGRLVFTATPVCVFQQAGPKLTGTCKGPNSMGPAAGVVDGATISFQSDVTPISSIGATGALQCSGVLGPDGVIRGQMRFSGLPGLVGAFTAQR